MADIHFVLQGKGGVGKSLVASLLAQYLRHKEQAVRCFDTDPINTTLAGYADLQVEAVRIMDGDHIDPRRFDRLMEALLPLSEEAHAVVDNGAATFVPLSAYLLDTGALDLLEDEGHIFRLHTVVTGGQAILDTLAGLQSLAAHFPKLPLVVWLNAFFGEVALDGTPFELLSVAAKCQSHIQTVITLPNRSKSLHGRDLEELFARRQTFAAAIASDLPIMTRQRLKTFWRDTVAVLDEARLC